MSENRAERRRKEREKKKDGFQMQVEILQPWSTFVMKTQLPPPILEKMIKITDEILKNKEPKERVGGKTLAQDYIFFKSGRKYRTHVTEVPNTQQAKSKPNLT